MDLNNCGVCKSPDETGKVWLECDGCGQWFHSICLKISVGQINEMLYYHCRKCEPQLGPSVLKRRLKRAKVNIDYTALNEGDSFAIDKSIHPHVYKFHDFANEVIVTDKSNTYVDILSDLTVDYVMSTHITKPILIPENIRGVVGMELPCSKEKITIDYILDKVGSDTPVEVMDVLSQQGVSPGWRMQQWRDYFVTDETSRDRIRNVISLEISEVEGLGKEFKRPDMVNKLDLIDKIWDNTQRPQVTKYCLMSVNGSFTDFHIDFGGTSVYYTVCRGSKTFLMFPPTPENLDLYTSWCLEENQNYIWYPEYLKSIKGKNTKPQNGFKVTLNPGDIFIIPSGWIHCVHTPQDSLVIGGNFLTMMNMKTQIDVYNIEKQTNVPMKFRHPQFNRVIWLASWYYFNHKTEFLTDIGYNSHIKQERVQDMLTQPRSILTTMLAHIENHYELSKTNQTAKKSIPSVIGNIPQYLDKLHQWSEEFK